MIGHNGGICAEQLLSYVQRAERLHEERAALSSDISDLYKEAKGNGFDVKTLKAVIRRRAIDRDERDEQDTLLQLYEDAIAEASRAPARMRPAIGQPPAAEAASVPGASSRRGASIGADAALQGPPGGGAGTPRTDEAPPRRGHRADHWANPSDPPTHSPPLVPEDDLNFLDEE